MKKKKHQLNLKYPCKWEYKIIGMDESKIRNSIEKLLQNKSYKLILSNKSKNGKYQSFNLETIVESEKERKTIFQSLGNNSHIKIVL